jgi:hypothetical protein
MMTTLPKENEEQRAARYADLMRYPEWRVFAWKCKEARGFVCQTCAPGVGRRGEKGLEVHHWWYEQDRWPWDYAPEDVAVLCEPCHEALHAQLAAWKATTKARWQRSEQELKRFVADFRRFVFPGLTPESFAALNMTLALGVKGSGGPLAALAIRGLMSR